MTIAAFSYSAWSLRFPELAATVSEPLADQYFLEAGLLCDNTDQSPVVDIPTRLVLLNLLVAHIAALNGPGSSPLVGRISNATEGSVSVGTAYTASDGAAYFTQTKYGAQFWQLTAPYRTMHYVPGRQPYLGVPYGMARPSWGV
ncbi:MAG: DUF4054 domain-containing protein [Caulobacteraceae bacterium]